MVAKSSNCLACVLELKTVVDLTVGGADPDEYESAKKEPIEISHKPLPKVDDGPSDDSKSDNDGTGIEKFEV